MAVLLIAEHDNASLKDATHKALTAAAQMGGDVHVLVAGNKAQAAAGGHHRPAPEPAALRLTGQHHEGEVEAAR